MKVKKKKVPQGKGQLNNNLLKIDFKKNKIFFVVLFLSLVLVIFFLYKAVIFIQNPTDTFRVEQGKIYQEERGIGYIIREETVTKGSNYKNGMEQIKSEGEKVAKNEAIFRYYSSGEDSLVKKIEDLDAKIEEAMSKESFSFPSDIKTLDKQIEDKIVSLEKVNDMQTIRETKKEIANNITKKAKIAGELSPAGSYLKKLVDERSKYENQLNEGIEALRAPISGIVSYKVDGYEEVLTPNDFSTLSTQFLEDLNLKTGQVAADSKESAKIINNFECYIACSLNSKQAKEAEVGDTVKLRLLNDTEVSGKIVHISNEEENVLIVFEINRQVKALVGYRKISFDIIWWSDSGKKISNDAINYEEKGENKVAYITRIRGNYQDKIWVKVKRQNDKYAIVENYTREELENLGYSNEEIKARSTLSLYDEILQKTTSK